MHLLQKFRNHSRLRRQIQSLKNSSLFDADWYVDHYPDVRTSRQSAYEHYLRHGAAEGRNPGPDFDAAWYLQQYPDVAAAGLNPLIHYLEHGAAEGREIRPIILAEQARPVPEALKHSIEVLTKSHLFDPDWYLREYPDVARAGEDPAVHYLVFGAAEKRNPGPGFDGDWYLKCHEDVAAAGLNPLIHYLETGAAEGREIRRVIHRNAIERKIESRFGELKPLRTFHVPSATRRLTVLLNGEDLKFAGSGTRIAVVLGAVLAQHMGASLRFAMPAVLDTSIVTHIWKANGISWSGEIEFANTAFEGGRDLGISENDFFLTTSWKTTWSARSSVNPCRIIYLLQDDERMAYPFGDDRLRCEEILTDPELFYMIVSEMLFEHLTSGPTAIWTIRRRGVWFERAIPIEPYPPAPNWKFGGAKRNFLFDARQSLIGNLYWRGLEVIRGALEEGLFKTSDWEFYFLSDSTADLVLPGDIRPLIISPDQADVTDVLRHLDVSLCLADTPYLSYPILELAANGAVVVTNRRRTKSSLGFYSDNILDADPSIETLKRRIGDAIRLAKDDEMRSTNYFRQQVTRDWTTALGSAVERILSLAGIWTLQRC